MYVNNLFYSIFFIQCFNMFIFYFHFIPFHLSSSIGRYNIDVLLFNKIFICKSTNINWQSSSGIWKACNSMFELMETGWNGVVSIAAVAFNQFSSLSEYIFVAWNEGTRGSFHIEWNFNIPNIVRKFNIINILFSSME